MSKIESGKISLQSEPFIIMDAMDKDDIEDALSCGMNAHIAKPIDINEANRIIERLFDKG